MGLRCVNFRTNININQICGKGNPWKCLDLFDTAKGNVS